jgi:hypothetical protein
MSASIARLISAAPLPIFGSLGTAMAWTAPKVRALPRFAGWLVPLGAGALWFVWPAVDDGWKIEMGLKADPEAAAKAAAATKEAAAASAKRVLSPAALAKVEGAYKGHAHVETEDDKLLAKAASSGDYGELEAKWEAFLEKSSNPGEDDDEEEDEEDEDEDEDAGGEDEEEEEDDD